MSQSATTTAPDLLGETLGSLLGELAWDEIDRTGSARANRRTDATDPRQSSAPAALSGVRPTEKTAPSSEAWSRRALGMGPWQTVLDALAGRKPVVKARETAEVRDANEPAPAVPTAPRPLSAAMQPWSYVLARLAGRSAASPAPGPQATAANAAKPAERWQTVAKRSPGETVSEMLGSVDWT